MVTVPRSSSQSAKGRSRLNLSNIGRKIRSTSMLEATATDLRDTKQPRPVPSSRKAATACGKYLARNLRVPWSN
eukprot:4190575-Pyramimonas_sp.AAC.1